MLSQLSYCPMRMRGSMNIPQSDTHASDCPIIATRSPGVKGAFRCSGVQAFMGDMGRSAFDFADPERLNT
jgi:hypothetical protein